MHKTIINVIKGIVRNFGHRTSFPNEPVCYLSLKIVFNTFHSVLLVAEIAGARLAQVNGPDYQLLAIFRMQDFI